MRWTWPWKKCSKKSADKEPSMDGVAEAKAIYERQVVAHSEAERTKAALKKTSDTIRQQRELNHFGLAIFDAMRRKGI